jgi:hypothetical protein
MLAQTDPIKRRTLYKDANGLFYLRHWRYFNSSCLIGEYECMIFYDGLQFFDKNKDRESKIVKIFVTSFLDNPSHSHYFIMHISK